MHTAYIPQSKFLAKCVDLKQPPEVAAVKPALALSDSGYSSLGSLPPQGGVIPDTLLNMSPPICIGALSFTKVKLPNTEIKKCF